MAKKPRNGKAQTPADAAERIAQQCNSDVIFFAGSLFPPVDADLVSLIGKKKNRPNALLLLTTDGGLAEVAFRITRYLQHKYDRVTIYVHSYCKSAGTLMALGANEIVMGDLAELGPLDVQVYKHDEVGEMSSGLTPVQALNTLRSATFTMFEEHFLQLRARSAFQLTTKTAAEIASKLTIGVFRPIFQQLDPMRLGEIQRAMMIAYDYGARLQTDNVKKDVLKHLIADYPAHGFAIDRDEAATLFSSVRPPSQQEDALARRLASFATECLRDIKNTQVLFLSAGQVRKITKGTKQSNRGSANGTDSTKQRRDVSSARGSSRGRASRNGRAKSVQPAGVGAVNGQGGTAQEQASPAATKRTPHPR